MANTKNYHEIKYSWFAIILYEDDEKHMDILQYILNHRSIFLKLLYIRHDKDKYNMADKENENEDNYDETKHKDGEFKKAHYHVMFKYCKATSPNAIISHFMGIINYCTGLNNHVVYAHYMLHDTFEAIKDGKYQYEFCELKGDRELIKAFFIQNTNTVEFLNILKTVKSENNMIKVFEKFERENDVESVEYCLKHGSLLIQLQNQYINNIKYQIEKVREDYELYNIEKRYMLNHSDELYDVTNTDS